MPRLTLPVLLLVAAAAPAGAQTTAPAPAVPPAAAPAPAIPFEMPRADDPPPAGDRGSPFDFPRRDAAPSAEASPLDELFSNMLRRAEPHLEGLARDMGGLFNEYGPAFEELTGLMDDIANYELPPERLPNGDILIRRKAGAPPPPPLEELPNFLPKGDTTPAPPAPAPGNGVIVTPGGQVDL